MEEINIIISKIEDNLGECYSYQNGDDVDLIKDLIKDLKEQLILSGVVKPLKDKKAPTFEQWKEMYNYTRKTKNTLIAHGKIYYNSEVYKQYNDWCRSHF